MLKLFPSILFMLEKMHIFKTSFITELTILSFQKIEEWQEIYKLRLVHLRVPESNKSAQKKEKRKNKSHNDEIISKGQRRQLKEFPTAKAGII